jgi:GxxExxY protein
VLEESRPQMNADKRRFRHEDITRGVIGAFFEVYNELGYGFLESVYREAMVIALESNGLRVEKEFGLEARFRGQVVGLFKADLLVNGCVIVELKALKQLHSIHEAQTLNYLRAGVVEVALLLNFGPEPQIKRLAFSNDRKGSSAREQIHDRTQGSGTYQSSICVHPR